MRSKPKTNLENRAAHRRSALRGGIDLLAHSTYPRGDSVSRTPRREKRYLVKVHQPGYSSTGAPYLEDQNAQARLNLYIVLLNQNTLVIYTK